LYIRACLEEKKRKEKKREEKRREEKREEERKEKRREEKRREEAGSIIRDTTVTCNKGLQNLLF